MAVARVVSFNGVSNERIEQLRRGMSEGDQPEGLDATEFVLLHDPQAGSAVAILFFDSEDAYERGDAVLNAMPAEETPGQRASVAKYDVAVRMTT
jgi:hypothetical protein